MLRRFFGDGAVADLRRPAPGRLGGDPRNSPTVLSCVKGRCVQGFPLCGYGRGGRVRSGRVRRVAVSGGGPRHVGSRVTRGARGERGAGRGWRAWSGRVEWPRGVVAWSGRVEWPRGHNVSRCGVSRPRRCRDHKGSWTAVHGTPFGDQSPGAEFRQRSERSPVWSAQRAASAQRGPPTRCRNSSARRCRGRCK